MSVNIIAIFVIVLIIGLVLFFRFKKKRDRLNLEENLRRSLTRVTKEINWSEDNYQKTPNIFFAVDNENKKIVCYNGIKNETYRFDYHNVFDYAFVEDGDAITTGNSGKVLAGHFFLGGVGAIAGASASRKNKSTCFNMEFQIALDDVANPLVTLPIITKEVEKNSDFYKKAQGISKELEAVLKNVVRQNINNENQKQ